MSRLFPPKSMTASVFACLLGACAQHVDISYQPANLSKGSGEIRVETFEYLPAAKGDVEPNEAQQDKSGLASTFFQENVDALFTGALKKELGSSGYALSDGGSRSISGEIQRFSFDWVGMTGMKFDIVVHFTVATNGKVVYSNVLEATREARQEDHKLDAPSEPIELAMADCIGRFIRDAQKKGAL
ncbi:hypothetical protein [Methylococcus capsulatus]|uniref:hypothetical protein n=1 Tax=Methylococcus capsulatus TaxID=414 RepID=UPI001C52E375|nr:hypothetical protein [Methylococcus capsulatus]QXP88817.1 hypothetical protein KW112_06915 [Methylococcus capsulatus]QXP89809.1 hypothetical protein KW114_12040 [Methylococcus capsulatus]QXP94150.1 hypothetical protein KW113_02720 [Methylococcus capsulatus]